MKTKARFSRYTASEENRGQSAVEYMMNYGWVLIAIVVGMIIVWQSFDFTPKYTERRIAGFSEIKAEDFSFSLADNKLRIYLRNEAPARGGVQITAASADLNIQGLSCTASGLPATLNPTAAQVFALNCPQLSQKYKNGEYAKAIVSITYTNPDSGNSHKSNGVLVGYAETYQPPANGSSGGGMTTTTTPITTTTITSTTTTTTTTSTTTTVYTGPTDVWLFYYIGDTTVDRTLLYTNAYTGSWHHESTEENPHQGTNSFLLEDVPAGDYIWNVWVDADTDYWDYNQNQNLHVS